MLIYLSLLIAILGLVIYAVTEGKLSEIGKGRLLLWIVSVPASGISTSNRNHPVIR